MNDSPTVGTSQTVPHAADALQRFRETCHEESDPDLSAFVSALSDQLSPRVLLDLIKFDLDFRWRSDRGRGVEEYLDSWPQLRRVPEAVAELASAEYVARSAYHVPPTPDEFCQRFPDITALLEFADLDRQAIETRNQKSYEGTGRYFLVRRIGGGGMGEVFAAWDRERQGVVAVKTLPTTDPRLLFKFKQEFRALSEIAHPNLVPPYELFSSGDKWFFTMELIDGVDLLAYLRRGEVWGDAATHTYHPGALDDVSSHAHPADRLPACYVDVDQLEDVLRQVAAGLTALHDAGNLHRDVKPSNILVRKDGRVMILDFGLIAEIGQTSPVDEARPNDRKTLSPSEDSPFRTDWAVVGTAAYMSPEQAAGKPLTPATDWYAVGVILYMALTGRRPFVGPREQMLVDKQRTDPPRPSELCSGVPAHLDDLCVRLMRRDPESRPSGAEIVATLMARETSPPESRHDPLARDAPFVGRQRQLRALRASFDEMLAGRMVVVDVSGPSGVGKSRLLRHFLRGVQCDHDTVVLHGRCYERESVPFKALDLLVDSLSRYLITRPEHEIDALLPHHLPALTRLFPVLRRVDSMLRAPTRDMDVIDAQEMRQQATQALQELLVRIGDRHPLVLWIDDLQWDDDDSAAVLSAMIQQARHARLMLLLSFRSEQSDRARCLSAIDRFLAQNAGSHAACSRHSIEVGPLRRAEAEELAMHLMPKSGSATPAVVRTIARQSQGTPYFVQELVRFASSQNDLSRTSDAIQQLDLRLVLTDRVRRLPDAERRLLETIAVAGQPLKLATAYTSAALGSADRQSLVNLCSAHLLRTTGPALGDDVDVFHDRVRDSVMSLLPTESLQARHQSLALALERHHDNPEMIATHFHRAGQPTAAIRYYLIAADQAAGALAFERAARLYEASLDLTDGATAKSSPITRKLADALANAGHGRRAAEQYLNVAAMAPGEEQLELRGKAAYHYCASGHIAEGRREFAAILSQIGSRLPRSSRAVVLSLLWHRFLLRMRGLAFHERREDELSASQRAAVDISWSVSIGLTMIDTIQAADFQARNLLLSLQAGEPYRIVRALAWQASHIATGGVSAKRQTEKMLDAAESLVARVNVPHATALLAVARGIACFFLAEWPNALRHCDEGDAILREQCTGVSWERATARSFSLWSLYFMGATAELMTRQPELLREARQRGDLLAEASLTNLSGTLMWLARNQPREALDNLASAMRPWHGLGFRTQHFTSLASHVQIALYTGDHRTACQRLDVAWQQLRGSMLLQIEAIRIFMLHLRGSCAMAAAFAERGNSRYERLARSCARRLGRERAGWGQALGRLISATLLNLHGDEKQVVAALGVAASHLEEARMGLYAAAARYRQGKLIGGDAGRGLVEKAERWMKDQQVVDVTAMVNVFVPGFRS